MIQLVRKILHIDMDAFFASVEQLDDASLRGKPIAVGGSRERGVVAAASYEARKFGVHSAMPSVTAKRVCPSLIFVPPRFNRYREVSQAIKDIFYSYTPIVEPLSLDEAYLDVTEHMGAFQYASDIAKDIRKRIMSEIGLTASAGISYCKFLAKMASDQRKPNGQFVIPPEMGRRFVEGLPISKFHGIGPATARKMSSLGIENGAQLGERSEEFLIREFGKAGAYYYLLAQGIDTREVNTDRVRKSVGAENTFSIDLDNYDVILSEAISITSLVWARCEIHKKTGRTATLKVKFDDFTQITRSKSIAHVFVEKIEFESVIRGLIADIFPLRRPIRLIGVTMSGFQEANNDARKSQLDLFSQ